MAKQRYKPEQIVPLRAFDTVLTRVPLLRWLAWNVVMWGEKAAVQKAEVEFPCSLLNRGRGR